MTDQNIWLFSNTAVTTCSLDAISHLPVWHCTAPERDLFFFFSFLHFFCLRSRKSCEMNLYILNVNVDIKYDRSVGSFYNLFHMNFNTSKRTNWRIIRHRTPETIPHSQDALFYTSWHAIWITMNLNPFTLVCITSDHATFQGYFPLPWRNKTNHCNFLFFFAWLRSVSTFFPHVCLGSLERKLIL